MPLASQPCDLHPAGSSSVSTAEQTSLISWTAIPCPTPQFAFSVNFLPFQWSQSAYHMIQWVPEGAQCSWEKYVTGGWKEAEEGRVGAPCCRGWDLLTQLQLYWETVPLLWCSWREMMFLFLSSHCETSKESSCRSDAPLAEASLFLLGKTKPVRNVLSPKNGLTILAR